MLAMSKFVLRHKLPAGSGVRVTGMNELTSGGQANQGFGVLAETLLAGAAALAVLALVFGSALALMPLLMAAVAIPGCFLAIFGLTERPDTARPGTRRRPGRSARPDRDTGPSRHRPGRARAAPGGAPGSAHHRRPRRVGLATRRHRAGQRPARGRAVLGGRPDHASPGPAGRRQ